MDRGVVHKSSAALVREMGEAGHGHGWWSMNNLMRPPCEQQHHPSLFMPSTTTAAATAAVPSSSSASSALHSFSSLLLSNHYPLPTTTSTSPPWQHDSTTSSSHGQQDSWIQLFEGGLSSTSSKESQTGFPNTICSEAGGSNGGSYVVYGGAAAASHGSSTSDVEIQFPWGSSSVLQQNKQQRKASSPRSSSITTTTTTSLGSNMLEFSNNSSSSPRECISTASGSAFKKARTQEPSPAQSTVKVRKEKLGDRITALHQLVSPFGKTDTASVLLEAIGYIRFLHGQIEALSSPYVGVSSKHQQQLHEASVRHCGSWLLSPPLPRDSFDSIITACTVTVSARVCTAAGGSRTAGACPLRAQFPMLASCPGPLGVHALAASISLPRSAAPAHHDRICLRAFMRIWIVLLVV